MPKNNLPTYAIVELLIRLAQRNLQVGDYKDHAVNKEEVIVKTSRGSIRFAQTLIVQQFESPELITEDQLSLAALSFRAIS